MPREKSPKIFIKIFFINVFNSDPVRGCNYIKTYGGNQQIKDRLFTIIYFGYRMTTSAIEKVCETFGTEV